MTFSAKQPQISTEKLIQLHFANLQGQANDYLIKHKTALKQCPGLCVHEMQFLHKFAQTLGIEL